MENYPRWRRRQHLVNPEHQLRFTQVLLTQMTAVMLAMSCFAFLESRKTLELVLRHINDFPGPSHQLHMNNQAFLVKIILIIGLTGLFQIVYGIYASHKLAGPVHKMMGILDRAARGDFKPRARFRDGDQLEELADALNTALEGLGTAQSKARAEVDAIEASIQRLTGLDGSALPEAELSELHARIGALAGSETQQLQAVGQ